MKTLSTSDVAVLHSRVEVLETRIAPAVFVVTSLADTVAVDGLVTLREAINAANTNALSGDASAGDAAGDVIFFATGLLGGTITLLNGEFSITDDLAIHGTSAIGGPSLDITIDGNLTSRIFNVSTSEAVLLNQISLTDGLVSSGNSGGAIFVNSGANLTISNATIFDCDAAVSGGAIFNNGGVVTIADSTLRQNAALGSAVTDGGGAIFNMAGTLTISNSTITGNTASQGVANGGGIMSVGGSLTITGGSVSENLAARAGGGIEVNAGLVTLTGVTLAENTAQINGGGLHTSGAATARITGGVVEQNIANQEGGGLWNSSTGSMTITSVLIDDNTANGNNTEQGGGGVFNDGGTVRIVTSTIQFNTATAAAVGNGGGGIFNDGTMTIAGSTISGNVANTGSGNGGGILNSIGATLTVLGSTLEDNESARAGGAIENNAGTVILTNVDMISNSTGINGGAVHTSGAGSVTVNGGSVIGNVAGQEGGGLWNSSSGIMIVQSSAIGATQIIGNTANGNSTEQGGGGIFNDGGTFHVTGALILENTSTATSVGNGGGGVFNDGVMTLTNVHIAGNLADEGSANGGGILNSNGGQLTIAGGTISSNSTARAGGGLENNAGVVTISDTLFEENFAGINGGGIHTSGAGSVTINGGSYFGNEADNEGGALWNSNTGTMQVNGATIEGNHAVFGGGVFNDGTAGELTITNSAIFGNIAQSFGGGVASEGGELTIVNSTISGNHSASTRGGGVISLSGILVVRSSTVAFNTAVGDDGGGIVVVNGAADLQSTIVSDNTRDGQPSDLVRDAGTINAVNSLIFSNGAAINGSSLNNILGQDPLLQPLAANGGETPTHLFSPASPAVNAGSVIGGLTTDQRGEGFDRVVGLSADIGAVELQSRVPANSLYAVASGKGDDVLVFDAATGNQLFSFDAFDNSPQVKKGVTVATADVNGDGTEDIIVGAGAGAAGPVVKVFSGSNGSMLNTFFAYDASFKGGVFVGAGDVNGDGVAEIVTGSGSGKINEPNVKVFSRFGVESGALAPFGDGFAGGVRVAVGDVNGDGNADIVTTPGKGKASPTVKVFDGSDGSLLQSFLAFPAARSQGVYVAAGDLDGDGVAEIITALDAGKFGNEIRAYRGFGFGVPRTQVLAIPAFTSSFAATASGVRVAVADVNLDGIADIIAATGTSSRPEVSIINPLTGTEIREQNTFTITFRGGVFVG